MHSGYVIQGLLVVLESLMLTKIMGKASNCITAIPEFDLCTVPASDVDWIVLLQLVIMN